MGVGVGQSISRYQSSDANAEPDMIGNTLEAKDGHLYFATRAGRHPVRVMATARTIRVGCTTLTREAWEVLKRKVDGERQ